MANFLNLQMSVIAPIKLGNQKKITEYFNVSIKKALFLKPKEEIESFEPPNNYFAFNLMEPTQFYDQTQHFTVVPDSNTADTNLDQMIINSENEEIVPTQIIQSGQIQNVQLSQSSNESFSW